MSQEGEFFLFVGMAVFCTSLDAMLKTLSALLFCALVCSAADLAPSKNTVWHDARTLTVEGKGWTNTLGFYDRLPGKAKGVVRSPVWTLSQDSAGIAVRFVSDSPEISARWKLRREALALPHMAASGVSGLDLYAKENGKWHWVGAGRPKEFPTNEVVVAHGIKPGSREYMLYLPLYNGVESVEIGVRSNSVCEPAPVRLRQPVVFYGTSILQGGCASRPGMAYPAQVGRWLDWPTINLGFSGNAHAEPEVAKLLAELDPAVYVIDPLPNMTDVSVRERIEPFVKTLRAAHPTTPIVLIEHVSYCDGLFVETRKEKYSKANEALKVAYQNLKHAGVRNLSYVSGKDLYGDDGEATVDGTHATDLGFYRMAEKVTPVVKKVLPR
jgi:hypothetical protein